MANTKNPLVIGIAGGTGSGKTTVALEILRAFDDKKIAFIQHDNYYKDLTKLPPIQRAAVNFDHPNSLDTELMIEHIKQLRSGQNIEIPIYDFSTHSRTEKTIKIQADPVIIVEGILIFTEPELRDVCDVKIFVDTDADIRLIRRIHRDITERERTVESVMEQYQSTVRPMHLEFVEPSKRYADIIIPEGGRNKVAIEMVIARIENAITIHQQSKEENR